MAIFKWFKRRQPHNGALEKIKQRRAHRNPTRSDVKTLAQDGRLFVTKNDGVRSQLSEAAARRQLDAIVSGKLPVYEMVETLEGGYKFRRRLSKSYMVKAYRKWVDYAVKNFHLLSKHFTSLDALEVTLPRQFAFAQMSEVFIDLRIEEFQKQLSLAEKSRKKDKLVDSFQWALNRAVREKTMWKNRQADLRKIASLVRSYRASERGIARFQQAEDFFSKDAHQLKRFERIDIKQLGKATKGVQDAVLHALRERSKLLHAELEIYRKYKYRFSNQPISMVEKSADELDKEVVRVAEYIVSRHRRR